MSSRKTIIFCHLLNDYSGSPKILSLVIGELIKRGYSAELYTSSDKTGFLSGLNGVRYHIIYYRFKNSRLLTLFLFFLAQIRYFLSATLKPGRQNLYYINTVFPFGAALGAKLRGSKIIYHLHEYPVRVNLLHRFAFFLMKVCSTRVIMVSKYLYDKVDLDPCKKVVVYNSLPSAFSERASATEKTVAARKTILMACSLKKHKGVGIFIDLARRLPEYDFCLAVNAEEDAVRKFLSGFRPPLNMSVPWGRSDLHEFYSAAHLVLNLSIPEESVETFGLTVLEGFCYGIPAIVPPAGGITELVLDGFNGFRADPGDITSLIGKIKKILDDDQYYSLLSRNAKETSERYSFSVMIDSIEEILRND